MSSPGYTQVPPADFQPIYNSYPPPPQQSTEKKQFSSNVEEHPPPPPPNHLSLSPGSGPTKKGRFFRLRSFAHKVWLLEACASVLSLALFGAILVVLFWYDQAEYGDASSGQQSPNKRPTIFPALAILGAVMRAAMLLPVGAAIGQLKWSWFRTGRRLIDMERFDEAGRGILGSAKLIWALRFRNIAAVGAALTILALPLDAVIQSSVLIPSKIVFNDQVYDKFPNITDKTSMPRSTWYNASQIMDTPDRLYPETPLINAIRFGQSYTNGLDDLFSPVMNVDCPTGNCDFPKAQTLAIISKCVDRTSDIITHPAEGKSAAYKELSGTNLTLYHEGVQGMDKQIISTESNAFVDISYVNQTFGSDYQGLIVRTAMMLEGPNDTTLGYECVLSWSVRTINDYVNATSNFQLASWHDDVEIGMAFEPTPDNWWVMEPKQCFVQGQEVPKTNTSDYEDNCLFAVGHGAGKALETMLLDDQDGFMGSSWLVDRATSNFTRMNPFITNIDAVRFNSDNGEVLEDTKVIFKRIHIMWQNIAYVSTFTVRHAKSEMVDGSAQYLHTIGTVYRYIYYYHIDWPRLALPAFIVGFAAMFVLLTAITTRKEYSWRRSALPLFFHGIEERERTALGDVRSYITMEDVAENLHVRLEEHVDTNGPRFVKQH